MNIMGEIVGLGDPEKRKLAMSLRRQMNHLKIVEKELEKRLSDMKTEMARLTAELEYIEGLLR